MKTKGKHRQFFVVAVKGSLDDLSEIRNFLLLRS